MKQIILFRTLLRTLIITLLRILLRTLIRTLLRALQRTLLPFNSTKPVKNTVVQQNRGHERTALGRLKLSRSFDCYYIARDELTWRLTSSDLTAAILRPSCPFTSLPCGPKIKYTFSFFKGWPIKYRRGWIVQNSWCYRWHINGWLIQLGIDIRNIYDLKCFSLIWECFYS